MPFDDSYNSYESFKLAHTKPVLVADKKQNSKKRSLTG